MKGKIFKKTEERVYDRDTKEMLKHIFVIRVTSGGLFFCENGPIGYKEMMIDDFFPSADVYKELIYTIRILIEDYNTECQKKASNKVIAVAFQVSGIISREDSCVLSRRDISFSPSLTMQFDYVVAYAREGDVKYRNEQVIRKEDNTYLDFDFNVLVDHTPEREAFFEKMQYSYEDIVLNVEDFINTIQENPKKLEAMIKNQLLLTDKRDEETD